MRRLLSKIKSEDISFVKSYIVIELEKIARQQGEDYHTKKSPEEFAEDLRKYRNKVYCHVMKEGSSSFHVDLVCSNK